MLDERQLSLVETVSVSGSPVPAPLLSSVSSALDKLLVDSIDDNYQGERVLQLYRLQQSDAFYRGIQNIVPEYNVQSGAISWTTYGQGTNAQTDQNSRMFDYNARLTKAYGDKYVAVLGMRPFWAVSAEPGDPTSEDDRRGASQVNLLIQKLHGQWNVSTLNLSLFYNLFKNGTTLGQVRPVTDGKRFGYYEVPDIQLVPQQVGVDEYGQPIIESIPQQVGVKKYPRSSVELDLVNGYVATWPFNVVSKSDIPWLVFECQRDRGTLLSEYPNARGIVGVRSGLGGSPASSDPASVQAAIARASAQSQTGTIRANYTNLWSWRQVWLAASTLQLIEDDTARAAALSAFPEGVRVTQIEGKIVKIEAVDLKSRISTARPSMSDYLFTDGASWGMFNMEDFYANLLEITAENLETGIPRYLTNPNYIDADAINRSRYSPNIAIEAIPGASDGGFSNAIKDLPTSRFPDQLPGMFDVIIQRMESFYGLLPQVYGQMPNNLTLGQARMMLNQGLMQLGTPGELATRFWEETMTNAVNLYIQTVQVNPDHKGQQIDLDLIRRSSWNIKGETGIPSSFAESKDLVMELLSGDKMQSGLADFLELKSPLNAETLSSFLGLPELENVTLDQIRAIKSHIDLLWGQSPVQGPPGPDGSPGQVQPSIPFDSVVFDPNVAAMLARHSLVQETGQQRQGTPGYANVRAFLEAANSAMPPSPAEPPRLQMSANLGELPANQAEAILSSQGISVPPASAPPVSTQSDLMEIQARHQNDLEKNVQQHAHQLEQGRQQGQMRLQSPEQGSPQLAPEPPQIPPNSSLEGVVQ